MASDDSPPDHPLLERTLVVPEERTIAGKYRLERLIGEGGMGSVYEAEHMGLGMKVAVKLLAESFSEDLVFVKRFRREARAAAAVQHENVVTVTDTGTDDEGVPFLVMELLDGESLASLLRRVRVFPPEAGAGIAFQILAGLGAAHRNGVVHRDLKPANVFLVQNAEGKQRVKILDFGISKFAADVTNQVTAEGAVIGTPSYMSPEQVKGLETDGRSDLYAVGVMLYRMVTGKLPFAGKQTKDIYENILTKAPRPPREMKSVISEELEATIMKSLAKDPADRFQTADEFQQHLVSSVPDLELTNPIPVLGRSTFPPNTNPSIAPVVRLEGLRLGGSGQPTPITREEKHVSGRHLVGTPMQPARPHSTSTWHALGTKRWPLFAALAALALVAGSSLALLSGVYDPDDEARPDTAGLDDEAVSPPAGSPVRYGIARYAEREAVLADHEGLARYLGERLHRPVEIVIIEPHELTEKLRRGDIDLAALSAAKYVQAKNDVEGLRLLATAANPGGPSYEGVFIVRADSGIGGLADLSGKVFCYVSESSTSGYVYPRAVLRRAGIDPDSAFRATRLTGDHATSVRMVAEGGCDAAAVYQSIVSDRGQHGFAPQLFRQVANTPRIPYDAYVVSNEVPPALAAELEEALLALEPGSEAARDALGTDRDLRGFVNGDDAAYDGAREILRFLDEAREAEDGEAGEHRR